jgi:hypothetical protein
VVVQEIPLTKSDRLPILLTKIICTSCCAKTAGGFARCMLKIRRGSESVARCLEIKNLLLIVAVLTLTIPLGAEGGDKEMMNPGISWPAASEGWRWDGKEEIYETRAIFDYIDGAGEVYLAYNFKNLTVRQFEKKGHPLIIAELYDMGSPNDAYGIFSLERQDEEAGIGQGSEFGGGLLRFWKGRYFVSVYADGEGPEAGQAVLGLGRAMADAIRATDPAPRLIRALPDGKMGLVEKSIRYLHSHILLNQRFFIATRNILNLTPRTEAVLAQYLHAGKKIHLLLVRYPDAKEAAAALQGFKAAYMPEASAKGVLQTEEGKWTSAGRVNEFVLIVFGAPGEREAGELIEETEKRIGRI